MIRKSYVKRWPRASLADSLGALELLSCSGVLIARSLSSSTTLLGLGGARNRLSDSSLPGRAALPIGYSAGTSAPADSDFSSSGAVIDYYYYCAAANH